MALNSRERLIAVGMAGVVVLYAGFTYGVQPYRAALADVETQIAKQRGVKEKSDIALARQVKLQTDWDRMGVKVTPAEADTRLSHYLDTWTREAHLKLVNIKPERSPPENKMFATVTSHATVTGRQPDLVRLMWALTNSPIPLKVDEVNITSKKEGTDDLQMTLKVTTLCVDPDAGKPANKGGRSVAAAGNRAVASTDRPSAGRDPL